MTAGAERTGETVPATVSPVASSPAPSASEGTGEGVGEGVGAGEQRDRGWMVWLLTVALALGGVAVAAPGLLARPDLAVPTVAGLVLIPLFAVAELLVIHLPTLRSAHGHSLREVPAVIGLSFLAPQEYVVVFVLGTVSALVLWERMWGVKLAFNAALFTFEAAVGVFTYQLILGDGDPLAPTGWAAALVAVLVTDLISAAAVTLAITITEGSFDVGVLREALRSGVAAACINTCVALIMVILIVVRPESLLLLGVVGVLLAMGYRVYTALARGGARTQLLYQFVDQTAAAQAPDEVVRVVLAEAAGLMHAESAHLVEVLADADSPAYRCHTWADGRVSTSVHARLPAGAVPWWEPALEGSSVLLSGDRKEDEAPSGATAADGGAVAAFDRLPLRPRDAVAAPLRARSGSPAALLVCDRSFEKETFGREDLQVFETLAAHAAVALERADSVIRLERLVAEREHEALHDPLSGLPNRRAFNAAVDEAMVVQAARDGVPRGVVLLLDLDDFKDVNDTLGHSAGDRLITVSGERLRRNADGLVARLGGDEFAVLLPGMTLAEGVAHARSLHAMLSVPVPLEDVELIVSSSIGVAEFSASARTAEALLAQADVAMYTAKADRSGVAVYRDEAGDSVVRRMALAADLPTAITEDQIRLWYQPQADTRSGAVTGFEALIRWEHPEFGMVPPPEIVAVAVRTGLVRRLTDALIQQALEARQGWSAAGHALAVSVNVTPGDIADPALVTRVKQELARSGTPAEALVLEVTESDAMKDPERSLEVLTALAALGVTVSIDDFGTGYSSLAYLDRLPVHEVKIDQSFVQRVERGVAEATVMSATVGLAHDLGLRVVAEGIETVSARDLVARLGVDVFQGYGLARPMPADQVLPWLAQRATDEASAKPGAGPEAEQPGLRVVRPPAV